MSNTHGMNWCRQATRLAVYLRDGLACAYCGWSVEDGAPLTLDHLTPRSKGGSNTPENLVTACRRCNSTRQDMPLTTFVRRYGLDPRALRRHAARELPRERARTLLAYRGSVAAVLRLGEGAA